MTAIELLKRMRGAGFVLSVAHDGSLLVAQARWIDDDLYELINLHRDELLRLLKANG